MVFTCRGGPAVFGYHEVFHACVCAAATCQYLAITFITARIAGLADAAGMAPQR
jgi:predicted membrane channel-forming protein YqfA (hemolysin III family)